MNPPVKVVSPQSIMEDYAVKLSLWTGIGVVLLKDNESYTAVVYRHL